MQPTPITALSHGPISDLVFALDHYFVVGEQLGEGAGWQVRSITVPAPMHADPAVPEAPSPTLAAEGRTAEVVQVRGFLRRQPHGPGSALRKWVYIASFESRRWVSPRPLRINVKGGAR